MTATASQLSVNAVATPVKVPVQKLRPRPQARRRLLERPTDVVGRKAQVAALVGHMQSLLEVVDAQRADAIIQAHIAAAIPLQAGAFEQAELVGKKIQQALAHIPLLTAREVALQTGSTAARPETLTAQWLSRRQIFGVDLGGHGVRYPAFQFQHSGQPWPALKQALPALLGAFPPLHVLLWFDTPHPVLEGKAPANMLHNPLALMQAIADSTSAIDIF